MKSSKKVGGSAPWNLLNHGDFSLTYGESQISNLHARSHQYFHDIIHGDPTADPAGVIVH